LEIGLSLLILALKLGKRVAGRIVIVLNWDFDAAFFSCGGPARREGRSIILRHAKIDLNALWIFLASHRDFNAEVLAIEPAAPSAQTLFVPHQSMASISVTVP
jgi:hypothetical protein